MCAALGSAFHALYFLQRGMAQRKPGGVTAIVKVCLRRYRDSMHAPFPQAPGAFQLQLQPCDCPPAARITFETASAWRDIALLVESGMLALPGSTRPRRAQDEQRGARIETMSNIVIYEDDGPMRALLKEWLGEAGYRVLAFAEPAGRPAEGADLVIVSVYMPKHAGMQRVRDVQVSHPQASLIAISSQFRSGLSTAGATAQLLGANQVIAKPLARENLLDA